MEIAELKVWTKRGVHQEHDKIKHLFISFKSKLFEHIHYLIKIMAHAL